MSAMEYTQKCHRISFLYYFKGISALVCMPRWQPHVVHLMLTANILWPNIGGRKQKLATKEPVKTCCGCLF